MTATSQPRLARYPDHGRPWAGVLVALPADQCGIVETARVTCYLALESAGQCGPCFNGLSRIATVLDEFARSRLPAE
jgi:NADH:ubiquinone oxidoreductase subunit F (NADH-binding)